MSRFMDFADVQRFYASTEVRKIDILSNWPQIISWIVLFFILFAIVSGKIRYETAAFGGLLVLGLLGIAPASSLFSGFAAPELYTVVTVLVMSEGIVRSGILTGLGKSIAKKIKNPEKQRAAVTASTWLMSAFMNNVGAIGLMLPTTKRMAKRAGMDKADFGMPIAYASILGGSVTLIGTASNLIVSTFRYQAFGESFKMFDFAAHGIAMSLMGLLVFALCRLCGLGVLRLDRQPLNKDTEHESTSALEPAAKRSTKNTLIVLFSLVPAIVLTAVGIIHPAVAFGLVVVFWLAAGIFSHKDALGAINIPIFLFLGSMISISAVLNETGALENVVDFVLPHILAMPPFLLILSVILFAAFIANILDNSVAAVLLSPAVILLFQSGELHVSADALLMAVAAGSSLGIVLPTHQATIVAMNSLGFDRKKFIKLGALIALSASLIAALVIVLVWI
jgi:di/tricarboxylate transporter